MSKSKAACDNNNLLIKCLNNNQSIRPSNIWNLTPDDIDYIHKNLTESHPDNFSKPPKELYRKLKLLRLLENMLIILVAKPSLMLRNVTRKYFVSSDSPDMCVFNTSIRSIEHMLSYILRSRKITDYEIGTISTWIQDHIRIIYITYI